MKQTNTPLADLKITKPAALKPGDTVAILSTSYPTGYPDGDEAERERIFEKAVQWVEAQGFRAKVMPNAKKRWHYLAGSDQERLDDLHAAFQDPSIAGILCARGGYGTMRFVDQVDFDLIRKNPKVFMGFSDLTTLHLAFYQESGLGGFYAPMATTNLIQDEPYSQSALLSLVKETFQLPYPIPNQAPHYHCIHPGTIDAHLTGGNMTLLASLCGTDYQPQADGHILFLEDWHEKHYSLDRKYQQLKLAGVLDNIKGLIFCDFSAIDTEPEQSLVELFTELTEELRGKNIPVGYGYSIGHGDQTGTLPYGTLCRFDASQGHLSLLESPFHQS